MEKDGFNLWEKGKDGEPKAEIKMEKKDRRGPITG